MKFKSLIIILTFLLISGGGLWFWSGRQKPIESSPGSNIILISLDALRPDHLGCYGYTRNTSPHLDRLARRGVRFTQAITNAPWTLPSYASLFTSSYLSVHKINSPKHSRLSEKALTFTEVLAEAGYQTAAFTEAHAFVGREYGLDQGFTYFDDRGGGIKALVARANEWLDKNAEKKFFLFLYTLTIHAPYRPPAPYKSIFGFDENWYHSPDYDWIGLFKKAKEGKICPAELAQIIRQYDGGIAYTDACLNDLLNKLKELNLSDKTLIIVTADHGEQFLEHRGLGHGPQPKAIYDETLKIPLLIAGPGVKAGTIDGTQVQLIDLAPTILDYLGLPVPSKLFQGRSIISQLSSRRHPPVLSEQTTCNQAALRTERWKFIKNEKTNHCELYDLSSDPREEHNLAILQPDRVKKFTHLLKQLKKRNQKLTQSFGASERREKLSPQLSQHLKALGYIP